MQGSTRSDGGCTEVDPPYREDEREASKEAFLAFVAEALPPLLRFMAPSISNAPSKVPGSPPLRDVNRPKVPLMFGRRTSRAREKVDPKRFTRVP